MTSSTTQPALPALVAPTDPAASAQGVGPKCAVINAHTASGRDWVAIIDLSPLCGAPLDPPVFWRIHKLKPRGHETIELFAGVFYLAKIGGQHFGLYIDAEGSIHYFRKKAFERELDRRFRDCAKDVDLSCDGDWSKDPFSRSIPAANLGESRWWLDRNDGSAVAPS